MREGLEVELHRRLPCSVSFTRGQERSVQFAIVGLPQVVYPLDFYQASGLCGCLVALTPCPHGARLAMVSQPTRLCHLVEKAVRLSLAVKAECCTSYMTVCASRGTGCGQL